MRAPTGPMLAKLNLSEKEAVYFELSRLYGGSPDSPDEIGRAKTEILTLLNQGVSVELLKRQATLAAETTEMRYRGKFSNLVANRFWERQYRRVINPKPYQPPGPYLGEIPQDDP